MHKNILKILLGLFFVAILVVCFCVINNKSFLIAYSNFDFLRNRLKAQVTTKTGESHSELINPYIAPIGLKTPELTSTFLKCERNSDCILVETSCCSCREGGTIDSIKAINKDLENYFSSRMHTFCTRYFIDNKNKNCDSDKYNCLKKLYPLPVCRNNKCEAVPYEKNETKRKALKDYSNDSSNDIGLSCEIDGRWSDVAKLNFWNVKITASIGNSKGCNAFVYFWSENGKLPSTGTKENVRFIQTTPQIDTRIMVEKQVKALCLSNNKIYGTAVCKNTLTDQNLPNIDNIIPFKNWSSGVWKCDNQKCVDDQQGLVTGIVYPTQAECDLWCFKGQIDRNIVW